MDVNPHNFKKAMGSFATGVTVVTARSAAGEPQGVTVNAFSSVSMEPPMVLICLGRRTHELAAYTEGDGFVVNILRDDQREASITFASRAEDKFDHVETEEGMNRLPLIKGCLANIQCTVESVHDGGDHVIVVGRVQDLSVAAGGQPLLYFRGAYHALGQEP